MGTQTQTKMQTRTTGVTTIALLVLRTGELKNHFYFQYTSGMLLKGEDTAKDLN